MQDAFRQVERERCRRIVELVFGGSSARAAAQGEHTLTQLLDSLMMIALRAIDGGTVITKLNDVIPKAKMDDMTMKDREQDRPRLTFETDFEADGRWIAECAQLPGVMVYGSNPGIALLDCLRLAQRVMEDKESHD